MPQEFHINRSGSCENFLLKSESSKCIQNEWRDDAHWWFVGFAVICGVVLLFVFDMLSHVA